MQGEVHSFLNSNSITIEETHLKGQKTRSVSDEEEKKESEDINTTTTIISSEQGATNMPIAINTSRPPSTASVPTNAGAPRTTTTSRRGGRTRSRSPPVMGGRPPAPTELLAPTMENPSSAAAAAAAAAKAFAGAGSGVRSAWPSDVPDESAVAYFNDKPSSASRRWPGEEQQQYMRQRYQHGPPPSHAYGDRSTYGHPPPPHHSHPHHPHARPPAPQPSHRGPPPPPEEYVDRRYRPHRYDPESTAGRSNRYSRGYYPPSDYRYDRDARSNAHPSSSAMARQQPQPHPAHHHPHYHHSSTHHQQAQPVQQQPPPQHRGGTTLVLGGTTPIHVPKKSSSPYDQRRESAASVFRGRPGVAGGENGKDSSSANNSDHGRRLESPQNNENDNSPQQILLSLRTPTTSFEERGPERGKKTGMSFSPDDPPAIQNSSHPKRQGDTLFERSPEGSKGSGSIDMAPSFILFNQSFDSFGDTNYFNVDSNLQNDSFGMPRTNSIENADVSGNSQLLRKNSSAGNASHQLLTAGSGALTIGYSPVNSFGNASSSASRRNGGSGGMMILGGSSARAASPTQVLGMYHSYSGGGGGVGGSSGRGDPLDEQHVRLSVGGGSFGGHASMSFGGGGRHFDHHHQQPPTSPIYYHGGPLRSNDTGDRTLPFYIFLRKYKMAFKDCMFLLPGLKIALLESPIEGDVDNFQDDKWDPMKNMMGHSYPSTGSMNPTPQDIAAARRRVECSICAFGGSVNRERSNTTQVHGNSNDSIFRLKDESDAQQSVTITPSSIMSPPGSGSKLPTPARLKYEEALPTRYYENESRLSWEFEENPPVEVDADYELPEREDKRPDSPMHEGGNTGDESTESKLEPQEKSSPDDLAMCKSVGDDPDASEMGSSAPGSPQPKMRYRCKLCGQPKQNHRCPYQQSLARSIGIMVYPAVNAFTAAEPGTIAAPLSEMNNFVDLKDAPSVDDTSPTRPTPEKIRRIGTGSSVVASTQVTPESMRSSKLHSPSPAPFATPSRPSSRHGGGSVSRHTNGSKKRSYTKVESGSSAEDPADLLFVEPMELKQEQFRTITTAKQRDYKEGYSYPPLPLPYAQRKRLSDNLFSLSNEVPKLTDECAQVLREAREKDLWDLAVAELMTQVIVIIHCPDGDNRFEGLRQYLLTLGIAC